jgi:tetratricopeptide (TPR) repeat protein
MFFHLGRYDEAIKDLTAAIEQEKDHAGAFFYRGYAHFKRGQLALAEADRSKAALLSDMYKDNRYE